MTRDELLIEFLSSKLRDARVRRRLTIQQAADRAELHANTGVRYEAGVSLSAVVNFARYARALGLTLTLK